MAFNTSAHEGVYFLRGTRCVNQMQCLRGCDGALVMASLFAQLNFPVVWCISRCSPVKQNQ